MTYENGILKSSKYNYKVTEVNRNNVNVVSEYDRSLYDAANRTKSLAQVLEWLQTHTNIKQHTHSQSPIYSHCLFTAVYVGMSRVAVNQNRV